MRARLGAWLQSSLDLWTRSAMRRRWVAAKSFAAPFFLSGAERLRAALATDTGQLLLTAALALLLLPHLRGIFWRQAVLGQGDYAKPWLLGALLNRQVGLLLLGIPTYVLIATKTVKTWSDIEHGVHLRRFVLVVLGVLAWAASTHGYNFYLDQSHVWDRLLLIGLFGLSIRTPLAVPWAAYMTLTLNKHNDAPFPIDQTDWRALIELLILFSVYLWVSVGRKLHARHFLFLALTHVGAFYLLPGLTKIRYLPRWSWLLENKITNMTYSAYLHGWLGFMEPDTIVGLLKFLEPTSTFLQGATLVIEAGAILLFVHRKSAKVLLLSFAGLHLGIMLLTGIFFWKWIAMDVALFLFLRSMPRESLKKYFLPGLIIPVAGTLIMWFAPGKAYYPPTLTWFSGKLNRVYEMEVVGPSGKAYRLDPNYLTPFDVYFHQGAHGYLDDLKHVDGIYGGMSHQAARALEGAKTREDFERLLGKYGRSQKNEGYARTLDVLLKKYFKHLNQRGSHFYWLAAIGPPHHLRNHLPGELYDLQEPAVRINIYVKKSFFNGETTEVLLPRRLVRTVEVPR